MDKRTVETREDRIYVRRAAMWWHIQEQYTDSEIEIIWEIIDMRGDEGYTEATPSQIACVVQSSAQVVDDLILRMAQALHVALETHYCGKTGDVRLRIYTEHLHG